MKNKIKITLVLLIIILIIILVISQNKEKENQFVENDNIQSDEGGFWDNNECVKDKPKPFLNNNDEVNNYSVFINNKNGSMSEQFSLNGKQMQVNQYGCESYVLEILFEDIPKNLTDTQYYNFVYKSLENKIFKNILFKNVLKKVKEKVDDKEIEFDKEVVFDNEMYEYFVIKKPIIKNGKKYIAFIYSLGPL